MSSTELKVPCIVYARVVGYYRPTFAWNDGRVAEWEERNLIKANGNIEGLARRTNSLLSREFEDVNISDRTTR